MLLLTKSKLKSLEVLIYKAFINSKISYDEFVLTNNVLKKFLIRRKIKNYNDK